jgi:peroxiredoxin
MRSLIIAFLMIPFFLLWDSSLVSAQFFEAGVEKLETPMDAPNFILKDLGGAKISLQEFRGKIVILNFFSPSCPVCRKQTSSFDKLDEAIRSRDLVFLTVAYEVKEKDLREYKKRLGISMPILIDEHGSVAKAYKVRGHHETFFINREGKIVGKTFAEKDWTSPAMKNLIHYLLRQK